MKLAHWQSSRSLHTDSLSTQGGLVNVELVFALLERFLRYGPILKIAIFGHETWNVKKSSRNCIGTPFTPHRTIKLIFALRTTVSEIQADFYETWPLAKVPEVAYILSIPRGRNWASFRSTGSGFRGTSRF